MEMDMERVICRKAGLVSWERVLGTMVEAVVSETVLDASKSVVWLLLAIYSLSNEMAALSQEAVKNNWDAIALLRRTASEVAPESKDDGETDEDDGDGEDEEGDEDVDDDGEDDLSGEEGSDDDDPEANGGGSEDDDDDDDDEDENEDDDGEEEEEDEEEDEEDEEESPQPPSKKRK